MEGSSINKFCPHAGKPVASNSLTRYHGLVVGFCNRGCRDDFAENMEKEALAPVRCYFDTLIKEHALKAD
jgi:hypothetical protein